MSVRALFFVSLCILARGDRVEDKRICGPEYSSTCRVTRVGVDHCSHSPRFCRVTYGKRYTVSADFIPYFTTDKMTLTTYVSADDDESFVMMKKTKRVCEDHLLVCPVEPRVPQTLSFDQRWSTQINGSAPVMVIFSNAYNQTESCCFSFKVKSAPMNAVEEMSRNV